MPLHHLSITCSLAHPHPFSPPATSLPLPPASSRGDQSRQSKACWACSSRTWRVAGHHWGSRGGAAQGQSQSNTHPPAVGMKTGTGDSFQHLFHSFWSVTWALASVAVRSSHGLVAARNASEKRRSCLTGNIYLRDA